MKLIFFTEARFVKNKKGYIYNAEGSLNYSLWQRYLNYFDSITIVARVKTEDEYEGNDQNIASGEGVDYIELPYFVGPKEFFIKRNEVKTIIKNRIMPGYTYLMRVPGIIGFMAAKQLKKQNIPYGVEVVGDPVDVFSKGSINHPLRLYFRYTAYRQLKFIVANASAALYVTLNKLQLRYPVKEGVFTTSASNVILREEYIKNDYKKLSKKEVYNLLCIGSLAQMYKAPDIVLKSLKQLQDMGINCKLHWLGAGKFLNEVLELSEKLGIKDFVNFVGYVSDRDVILEYLDESDIFILVSRTEGLPRVIIEAMARGLPVIGSNVGGIPELVDADLLVEKEDIDGLTNKIVELLNNLEYTNKVAQDNLRKSHQYSEQVLNNNRKEFYQNLINITKHGK